MGDGEMRFWRLLEAEMRLPGQRGPSRSLLRRPHHGRGAAWVGVRMRSCSRGLGRWDAEETKSPQTGRQGSWDSAVARGEEGVTQEGVSEVPHAPGAKTVVNGFRGLG